MEIKASSLVNILLSMVLVISIAANLTGAVDYDPWLDVTDDGYGGIDDIVTTAEHFGASGDPTKLCNITNWPIHTEVTVFFDEYLATSSSVGSDWYEASGYSYIHIIAHATGLTGVESSEIRIFGRLWDLVQAAYYPLIYYTIILSPSAPTQFLTIPIPCEDFLFIAYTDVVSECSVSLSYYLTWA